MKRMPLREMHRAGAIDSHSINGDLTALPKAGVGERYQGRWAASVDSVR
ncbi:MAG: hypothetical protein ABFS37_12775 [Acidobacteriota bacterium]